MQTHDGVLLDNDIALKACQYDIGGAVVSCATIAATAPSMLAISVFVLRSRVQRNGKRNRSADALEEFFLMVRLIEPSDEEVDLAADLEAEASRLQLDLDAGESLLLAIMVSRSAPLIITGDKRAIRAIEAVASERLTQQGVVACFEQLILSVARVTGLATLRDQICKEPEVDRSLNICFSCRAPDTPDASILAGLSSYIADIQKYAPSVLLSSMDLSSVVP